MNMDICKDCKHFKAVKKKYLKECASAYEGASLARDEIEKCQFQHIYNDTCFEKDVLYNKVTEEDLSY